MLGDASSGFGGNSVDAVEAGAAAAHDGAAAPSSSAEEERGSFGGNRWPRQETLDLLKIRSDMDVVFRDSGVKGPLWDEVSRKLAELGYHRSAKKCREKFENVYKYHKRTKEGRSGKQDGKTYRFFDQLQALENPPPSFHTTPAPPQLLPPPNKPHGEPPPMAAAPNNIPQNITVSSTSTPYNINPIPISQTISQIPAQHQLISSISLPTNPTNINPNFQQPTNNINNPSSSNFPSNISSSGLIFNSTSSSSSSSDEEVLEGSRKRRKRKWKVFFKRLTTEVIQKQEALQKRCLEAIEKREHERITREEAWRTQEMAKLKREREILAQERSMAAAKEAAVMAFLQKISDQQQNPVRDDSPLPQPSIPLAQASILLPQPPPQSKPPVLPSRLPPAPSPTSATSAQQKMMITVTEMEITRPSTTEDLNGENYNTPVTSTSSRWPKVEVEALIKLRASLDAKYQDNGPKGPLWEEISAAMKKLGYSRNAKRCKQKWENINKYFKKVKESNKKRPEDSKTCPYFHQLDALYKEKNKLEISGSMATPLNMVRPEQQWPPQQGADQTRHESAGGRNTEDMESEPLMDQRQEDDDDDEATDGNDEEEEDESGGNYEIVASGPSSNQ